HQAEVVTMTWIVADWLARERGAARWLELREALAPSMHRDAYVSAIGWLRSIEPRASFALRLLSRSASDSRRERVRAWARMAWWQAEVWGSRVTDSPFRRNELIWLEREPPRPSPPRGRRE